MFNKQFKGETIYVVTNIQLLNHSLGKLMFPTMFLSRQRNLTTHVSFTRKVFASTLHMKHSISRYTTSLDLEKSTCMSFIELFLSLLIIGSTLEGILSCSSWSMIALLSLSWELPMGLKGIQINLVCLQSEYVLQSVNMSPMTNRVGSLIKPGSIKIYFVLSRIKLPGADWIINGFCVRHNMESRLYLKCDSVLAQIILSIREDTCNVLQSNTFSFGYYQIIQYRFPLFLTEAFIEYFCFTIKSMKVKSNEYLRYNS